jgi:YbbR domain-containing protein
VKIITKNPTLKVISLILAMILWLFVKSKSEGDVGLVVPLEFVHCPSNLIVTAVSEDAITVRIVGPLSQLERLSTKEGRARIDLSGARQGTNTFDIIPDNFNIPKALKITQISPASVNIELDHVMDRVVHVKAVVRGKPARGYHVTKIAVDPPYVNLQGAKSQLVNLREVLTEEIDVSGLRETLAVEVPLKVVGLRLKEGVKSTVKVTVAIKKEEPRSG